MVATGMRDARVVVLGAGPSGSVAAAMLARRGFRTLLVDRGVDPRPGVGECLPPGIRPQLEKAGVWDAFLRAGHVPSTGIRSLWGGPEAADRDFVLSAYGAGWHVDRARFDAMMRESALRSGAESLTCMALRNVARTPSGWRLELATDSGNRHVECSFVVDATGRASAFARRVGARRRSLDQLVGMAGYFSPAANTQPIEAILLVEAVENGWWYTAPLPDGKLIAVFLADSDYVQERKLSQADRWLAQLRATMQQSRRIKVHGGMLDGGIRVMPAESSFLDRVAGENWIAAGDAAAAFDPLSSRGISSAVSGGLRAAHAVAAQIGGEQSCEMGNNGQAIVIYADEIRREYAEYLAHREIYYGIERRWPTAEFWKTRHTQPARRTTAKNTAATGALA